MLLPHHLSYFCCIHFAAIFAKDLFDSECCIRRCNLHQSLPCPGPSSLNIDKINFMVQKIGPIQVRFRSRRKATCSNEEREGDARASCCLSPTQSGSVPVMDAGPRCEAKAFGPNEEKEGDVCASCLSAVIFLKQECPSDGCRTLF